MNKFRLEDADKETQEAFAQGFKELLDKLSVVATLAIVKKGMNFKMENGKDEVGFFDQPTLLLQKKIEEVTPEIVSNNPEVNPLANENPTTN